MKIKDITSYLESVAPLTLQESYDNAGLIIGDKDQSITSVLVCLDVTMEVVDEAIKSKTGLIISHHPLIFKGLKSITTSNEVERIVMKAIKNNIALYACHTNLDAIDGGVNFTLGTKMGLEKMEVLKPIENYLYKLVTFIPESHLESVRNAIFDAGAGVIGNYNNCSFNLNGTGSFRAGNETSPYLGERGALTFEKETRFETILPEHLKTAILQALITAHPYEEVAYDLYPLANKYPLAGMGMFGLLPKPMSEKGFLSHLKKSLDLKTIRHTTLTGKTVKKVAICGGAGNFLIKDAIGAEADVFVSGDFKYHDFFEAEKKILITDIGHYESEHYVKELLCILLKKKFPTFAVRISEVNTNPVNFY